MNPNQAVHNGVGDQLHAMFGFLGQQPAAGCRCTTLQQTMNDWGPDKCEAKLDFLVKNISEEADRRKLRFPMRGRLIRRLVVSGIQRTRRGQPVVSRPVMWDKILRLKLWTRQAGI